jgi:hypothetical protein
LSILENVVTPSLVVSNMLYVARDDVIEKEFEDSIRNCFNVKFLGPAEWFLLLRIHQHKDKSYTLDQHCFVLNSLQCCNPNSEFPEPETPFSPDYTFSKDNQPVTDHDNHIIKTDTNAFPFTLLCVCYSLLPTTPMPISSLPFSNLQKPGFSWQSQRLCSYLAQRPLTTMPIQCHQILPRHHFKLHL